MKGTFGGWRRPVLAVVGVVAAGSSMLLSAPAYADHTPPAASGGVQFVYAQPEVAADRDHVIWHWTLMNNGQEKASKVTLIQHLDPSLKIDTLSPGCAAQGPVIKCQFDQLAPGDQQQGFVGADLPTDGAVTARINGRVTWQQGGAPDGTYIRPVVPVHA
ncbi:MAG: sle [Actinomycetia bacterium]|jgi:hypothetical protein|nr:sle [Actinomycetes bacterium]